MLLGKTEDDAPGDVFPAGVDGIARGLDSFAQAKSEFHSIIQSESPYLKERLDIRDLFRVFVLEPQQMFPRIRAQSGAFLMSAFHDRFERVGVHKWNPETPAYWHFLLKVPQAHKKSLRADLRLLNVTRESLFPSVDETATAITRHYEDRAKPR